MQYILLYYWGVVSFTLHVVNSLDYICYDDKEAAKVGILIAMNNCCKVLDICVSVFPTLKPLVSKMSKSYDVTVDSL